MKPRHVIAVFLAFLALYVATSGGHLYSPDEEIMFRVTQSLARHGTLAVEPMIDPQGHSFAAHKGVDGRYYAQYGIGNSLCAVPLYWLGDLAARLIPPATAERLFGFNTVLYLPDSERVPGPGLLRRFAVSFTGSIIGAATCALLWMFAWRIRERELAADGELPAPAGGPPFPPDVPAEASADGAEPQAAGPPAPATPLSPRAAAWLVTLAYGAGTMALPQARTFFSEPLATFFVLAAFYVLFATKRFGPGAVLLAGLWYALALLTRLDSAVVGPALGLYLALRYLEVRAPALAVHRLTTSQLGEVFLTRRFLAAVAAFCLGPLVFAAIHLWLNAAHFGSPFTSAYANQPEGIQFRTPLLAGLYGYFMSIGKSVFLFSPAIVLGLAGWRRFAARHLSLGFCLALAVALLLLFHARWQNWAGGWCWGPRHIFMAHAFTLLPAVGLFTPWNRWRRAAFGLIVLVGFGVQLYGASQNFIDFYIIYFRTPETPPNAYVMYSSEDLQPVKAIAPINDSIYVPQNSQWYRYAEMWQLGYCDNLWIRLWQRAHGTEQPLR